MDLHEQFWSADINELAKGYIENEATFCCLVCGESFEKGLIYTFNKQMMEASRAIQEHVRREHNGSLSYLLTLDKQYTGLSDNQQTVLHCLANDYDDRKTARELGISEATVRNYRFRLREKTKQARVFLAIMEAVDIHQKQKDLVPIHRTATMVDERYATTHKDKDTILKNHLTPSGRLKVFPSKEKKKLVILAHLIERFEAGREYTEFEVNQIIASFAEDYATLRRYLLQYGFMEREQDCSAYRVKQ
jgi:DNA-binding CsgD family transcriptional regulator